MLTSFSSSDSDKLKSRSCIDAISINLLLRAGQHYLLSVVSVGSNCDDFAWAASW